MALPTAYLTSTKRLSEIFEAMQTAKAPEKFTTRFLVSLGFNSKGDRLVINVLKNIGFLDDTGQPIDRYFQFLDQSQSAIVLAEGIEEAYEDLFEIRTDAQNLSKQEIVGKLKTLSQGQYSDPVINYMAATFLALCYLADFKTKPSKSFKQEETTKPQKEKSDSSSLADNNHKPDLTNEHSNLKFGGLVYNIQIVLPETRDPKVYDALFKSLKEHLQ
jgi:hypothetical protein